MNDSRQKVLLYSDGSYQALSAAVYSADLLRKNSNMHLTILQVQAVDRGSMGVSYNWAELRLKYKRYSWVCSAEGDYRWINGWPVNPDFKWIKRILHESDREVRRQYAVILTQTNNIFLQRKQNVDYQTLCLNISSSEKSDTSETVEAVIDFASKNSYDLIIIGSRGFSRLNRMIFGSFSHEILNKSPIPVLLVKKLPQKFIDDYLSNKTFRNVLSFHK